MKSIKFSILLMAILLFSHSVFAYDNYSPLGNANSTNISSFIESRLTTAIGNTYCVGSDTIKYFETFFDGERDYAGLEFVKHYNNHTIIESEKMVKNNILKAKLIHDPNIYDNPESISDINNNTCTVEIKYDSTEEKWRILDNSNK